jgi:hypothetical protein
MPGSRIPIVSEDRLVTDSPDFVVIFPWNIFEEITVQFSMQKNLKFKFVAPNLGILG